MSRESRESRVAVGRSSTYNSRIRLELQLGVGRSEDMSHRLAQDSMLSGVKNTANLMSKSRKKATIRGGHRSPLHLSVCFLYRESHPCDAVRLQLIDDSDSPHWLVRNRLVLAGTLAHFAACVDCAGPIQKSLVCWVAGMPLHSNGS